MAKNRVSSYPKQPAPAMSPSHIYTAGVAVNHLSPDDEDDNDICPVCDGDCTCSNRPPPAPTPISSSARHARHAVMSSASNSSSSLVPGIQSLKIKLTVPPSMQAKGRSLPSSSKMSKTHTDSITSITSDNHGLLPSPFSPLGQPLKPHMSIGGHGQQGVQGTSAPKRRGRPPKITTARDTSRAVDVDRQIGGNEVTTLHKSQSRSLSQPHAFRSNGLISRRSSGKLQTKPNASRLLSKSKIKGTIAKKASSKKKTIILSEDSNLDDDHNHENIDAYNDDDDDAVSGHFPAFVSSSAMSTSTSSDSDTSSSGLDTDSSMEAEEESYILTEERRQNRARVRRELLGEEGNKRKDPHNNWVIRPRKRSVGLSDVDMESDSDDATEGDEEAEGEEEEEGDDEDEDADGQSSSAAYAGVATGWSEDDESTFDADIFFANLSDIGSDDGSSTNDEAGLQSDMIPDESAATDIITSIQRSMDFEVTEGWDGQIVFTNGLSEGQGMVDIDFETSAAQLVAEDSATASQDSDVSMHSTDEEDDEYEEGECELGESDGETTEEELVDENGLPTSHAMALFRWPSSVSAINPLSTVSPTVSPSPHDRRTFGYSSQDLRDSPRPADILAGKVFWDESDEFDHPDGRVGRLGSITVSSRGGAPIMGQFSTESDSSHKTAILTGSNKDIPSPFPRLLRNKGRLRSASTGSFSSMDFRGRATSRPSSLSISTSSSFPIPSSEEPLSQTSPELPPTEPFNIDDVLDSSYLDSEPSDNHIFSSTASEGESHRHMQSLSRWDRIPMGTFRRTRETTSSITGDAGGPSNWSSEPQKATTSDASPYTNMMKSSPLSTMLWHGKGQNSKGARRKSKAHMNVIISPVLLPIRDGDRTPTLAANDQILHTNSHNHQQKSRKELRREMKMKRKNCGPVHQHHRHHQQHHYHNHLPNMKSRSTASMQRTNFFSSPSSVPPLNI